MMVLSGIANFIRFRSAQKIKYGNNNNNDNDDDDNNKTFCFNIERKSWFFSLI